MQKVFVINTAVCDTRKVQEETLAGYDEIRINSAMILVSPTSKALLNKYPVRMNTASVLELEEDVTVSTVNGNHVLQPGSVPPGGKCYLVVSGILDVAPGCEEILKSYVGIMVNGMVVCPESLSGYFTSAQVNGKVETYPDGYIRLKSTAILDKTFHLQAREGAKYYAAGRVVALDSAIDFGALAAKGVSLATKKLLVCESLCEKAIPLVNDTAEIVLLPDGCAYVGSDAILDQKLLDRYGDKLYINGSLRLTGESREALGKVAFLKVNGDLLATRDMADAAAGLKAEYGELHIVADKVIAERDEVTVDRALLEGIPSLSIAECERVIFDPDVPADLIREKIVKIRECELVVCAKEQRSAVELAAVEVEYICQPGQEPKEPERAPEEARQVNAASYVL